MKDVYEYNRERYGRIIREARLKRGIMQSELADELGTNKNYVSNWENGRARPDMNMIVPLCRALRIPIAVLFGEEDAEDPGEEKHMRLYRLLTPNGRRACDRMTKALLDMESDIAAERQMEESGRQEERARTLRSAFRVLYVAPQAVAAGTFNPLDEGGKGEPVWIRRGDAADRADEIIRVTGDSMQPTFYDGDELLVEHADALREGEIGVFVFNGDGYVKEYHPDGLASHNPAYPFRPFRKGDEVRLVGRVLERIRPEMRPDKKEAEILGSAV